jgi:hypothetical protein
MQHNATLLIKARDLWGAIREEIQKMPDSHEKKILMTQAIEDSLQKNMLLQQVIIAKKIA